MTTREILSIIALVAILAFTGYSSWVAYRDCSGGKLVRGVFSYECMRQ